MPGRPRAVRRTRRPWPVSTLETDGTFFRGRSLSVLRRSLLVAFDGEHVVAALIADPLGGVHLCVHGVGGDHYPVEVEPELHRLGWFVFQSGVFRWDSGGGVVVSGH